MDTKLKYVLDMSIGDGGVYYHKSGKIPHYSFTHSIKQKEYAQHKYDILQNLGYVVRQNIHTWKNDPKLKQGINVCTRSYPEFEWLYQLLYKNGKKTLTAELFTFLDDRSLAYWFMDDGFANTRNKVTYKSPLGFKRLRIFKEKAVQYYGFSNYSFSIAEQELFVKWLYEKYNITSRVKKEVNGYITVINSGNDKDKLKSIIEPYIIESMKYKMSYKHYLDGIEYNDIIERLI